MASMFRGCCKSGPKKEGRTRQKAEKGRYDNARYCSNVNLVLGKKVEQGKSLRRAYK
jgi:hypothetical protein